MIALLKRMLLPRGAAYRRIMFGPAAGARIKIDFAQQARLYFGVYEYELAPYFRTLVYPGAKCFDAGGADGYDALMEAKLSRNAGVVCFECVPEIASELHETLAQNACDVKVVTAFVGDADRPGYMTLDSAARQHFMPDFIKLDIEGAEVAALKGAHEILTQRMPNLIVETHTALLEQQCIELLRGYGYQPKIVDQRRYFKERRLGHNRWLICAGRAA